MYQVGTGIKQYMSRFGTLKTSTFFSKLLIKLFYSIKADDSYLSFNRIFSGIEIAKKIFEKREVSQIIMVRRILRTDAILNFISKDAVNRTMIKLCSVYKFVGFLV
jgi:hypothetical protein